MFKTVVDEMDVVQPSQVVTTAMRIMRIDTNDPGRVIWFTAEKILSTSAVAQNYSITATQNFYITINVGYMNTSRSSSAMLRS